jgi:hypothetical protein
MNQKPDQQIDWELCTPEGQDMDQLRHWSALPLRAKLVALEQMCDHARATIEWRRREGLPYIDPESGEVVRPERRS